MRIAVYGATGMIGRDIVGEAVSRGHQVTAISRTPGQFEAPVVTAAGDAIDVEKVAAVASAHDVVVSAMGPSRVDEQEAHEWPKRLAGFANAVAPCRLFVVGGAGTLIVGPGMRHLDSPHFLEEYRDEAEATAAGFYALLALPENISWTCVSPPFVIEPGQRTGNYKSGLDAPVGDSISTQDFAVAVVDELENPQHKRQRFTVAH